MAESEAASAATAASLQMSIVSFFTAPGTFRYALLKEDGGCSLLPRRQSACSHTGRSDGERGCARGSIMAPSAGLTAVRRAAC